MPTKSFNCEYCGLWFLVGSPCEIKDEDHKLCVTCKGMVDVMNRNLP